MLTLVALATSAALYVDYVSYSPAFCSPGSGCSAVRASGYGYLFNGKLPVPVIGMLGFGALYVVSLLKQTRRWLKPMAWAGSAIALGFIAIQAAVIHEFCKLCVIVDGSGLLIGAAAWLHDRDKSEAKEPLALWAWLTLGIAATVAPIAWPELRPQAPVPQSIQQLYKPGLINVVEFADFECPFCRALHPVLKKLVAERGDKVNFVRLNMPLQRHEHAMDAAKGAVCAEAQGKKEPMAELLFQSEDLSPPGVRRAAVSLGLDPAAFDRCIVDPGTQQQIQRESKILRDAGFQGLPTTYVGSRQLVGALGEDVFREAFEQAAHGNPASGIPGWLYVSLLVAGAGAVVFIGRRRAA